jgi:hypothetical protein
MSPFQSKRWTTSVPFPAAGGRTAARRDIRHRRTAPPPAPEGLESRALLSAFHPTYAALGPNAGASSPAGYTPAQIRHAYGFDRIQFSRNGQTIAGDGAGQTLAIVDAFDDPSIAADLRVFDRQFGLPDPVFTKSTPQGTPALNRGWATEIALDVEWAHAIAPAANILLVEAIDNTDTNLFAAVDYAARQPGVVAVSMSFGRDESSADIPLNYHFLTPQGHAGVTFVASSGDAGAQALYPAVSPNVLAVGGTTLRLNADDTWRSETGWRGSGGGISSIEAKPLYQGGVTQSATGRTSPDVAYDADPNTGFAVYNSFPDGDGQPGWFQIGGTSAGSPQWAALIAIAAQGRALAGQGPLNGSAEALEKLADYELPVANFRDITGGTNGYSAGPGYDLVTGLGSPLAERVVRNLTRPSALTTYDPGTGTLTVNRDPDVRDESITLNTFSFAGVPFVTVDVNGVNSRVGSPTSVVVHVGTGSNTINIVRTAAGIPTTINGNSGDDTVNIGDRGGLANVKGNVTARGGGGNDVVNFDDAPGTAGASYTVTSSTVSRPGVATISYDVENLNITGGSGNDGFDVTSSLAGTSLGIFGGGGADTLNVNDSARTTGNAYTVTSSTVSRPGAATISYNVENLNLTGGSGNDSFDVTGSQAGTSLGIFGAGGTDTLNVNDSARTTGSTYSVTSSTVGRAGAATISYDVENLNLTGGSGNDTFNVTSSRAGTAVSVTGNGGSDTLNVNDTASIAANTYTLTSSTVGRAGAATISYDVENLNLTGGSGNDTFNVTSARSGMPIGIFGGDGYDTLSIYSAARSSRVSPYNVEDVRCV